MTKKDFRALAEALYETRPWADGIPPSHDMVRSEKYHAKVDQWDVTIAAVADACDRMTTGGPFDRERFEHACAHGLRGGR